MISPLKLPFSFHQRRHLSHHQDDFEWGDDWVEGFSSFIGEFRINAYVVAYPGVRELAVNPETFWSDFQLLRYMV